MRERDGAGPLRSDDQIAQLEDTKLAEIEVASRCGECSLI
jgi:hypothetical protein